MCLRNRGKSIVPSLELVMVMTGGDYGNPRIQVWETSLLKGILASLRDEER